MNKTVIGKNNNIAAKAKIKLTTNTIPIIKTSTKITKTTTTTTTTKTTKTTKPQ